MNEDDDRVLGAPPALPDDVWERVSTAAVSAPAGTADPSLLPDEDDAVPGEPADGLQNAVGPDELSDRWFDGADPLVGPAAISPDGGPDDGDPLDPS